MSRLIYIDTNVYLDYFLGRTDSLRPLGEFAFQLFKKARAGEFTIIISSVVLEELKFNDISLDRLKDLTKSFRYKIFIDACKEDRDAAHKLKLEKHMDFNDAQHIILAKKANAECFVTRNIKHFLDLDIKIVLPEEI